MLLENEIKDRALQQIAEQMLIAARTAPKGRGINNVMLAIAEQKDFPRISEKMIEIGNRMNQSFFIRDAENILHIEYMLVLAMKINPINLDCGWCGFANCAEKNKHPLVPCVFNLTDLAIAIGSAVSKAADLRVDNRVMYSAGRAIKELNLLGEEAAIILCVPISATSKSPFFDRKTL